MESQNLSRSLEDYLETILELERNNRVARVKEIAEQLGVQMPSVTGALKSLKSRGLVTYEKNSYINLTREGLKIAQSIENRHIILRSFLEEILLLNPVKAEQQACLMEHTIEADTASRILNCIRYIQNHLKSPGSPSQAEWDSIITSSNEIS